jgi:hypothetical protein
MLLRLAAGPVSSPPPVKEYNTEWLAARAGAKIATESVPAKMTVPIRLQIIVIAFPVLGWPTDTRHES